MRILIVEDEVAVRTFLCRAVEVLIPDTTVVCESNGRNGLMAFLAEPADLVISDNRMPSMTGMEMLHTLRMYSNVPFIMVSAETGFERMAFLTGASACLNKPINLSDLRTAIDNALTPSHRYTRSYAS